jgi:3-dehydroquinate dehydratase
MIGGVCLGTISGLGLDSYRLAVDHLVNRAG